MTDIIFTEQDLRYYTGEPLSGFLILKGGKKYLYTSDFDLAKKTDTILLEKKRVKNYFFKILREMEIKEVGIDFSKLSYSMHESFKNHKIKLNDISEKLAKKMSKKQPHEIKKLKQAAKLADEAMGEMRNKLKPGITEQELAGIGQKYLKDCEAVAFPFIVEFGRNTMYTHYYPTRKKLKKHEMILIDSGFQYDGYHSDITRTFCIKPDANQLWLHDLVKYAQEKAVKKCRPNVKAKTVYDTVENIFRENNVLDYWKYGLGHGIGLRVHEHPSLHKNSEDRIYKNSAFTLEPGLAVPKIGGCRIEDDFIMKKKPKEIIKSDKNLEV